MHRNEWKWKHNNPKPMEHCKSSTQGKVHSNTGLPQEKSQINILTLHLKQLEKEEMKKPRVSRRKEILKVRAEKEYIWISYNEVDETWAYYTEWSKPERKTPIQYTNAYIWNLERW